ncbi:MAG: D-alanyl-D-alanine carboxypeptidase, partial [Mycobacterium sp.]
TAPGTRVGTLIEPDPALVAAKPDAADDGATAQAAAIVPAADALAVRVGVAIIGAIVVVGLMMLARSLNRRPQREF